MADVGFEGAVSGWTEEQTQCPACRGEGRIRFNMIYGAPGDEPQSSECAECGGSGLIVVAAPQYSETVARAEDRRPSRVEAEPKQVAPGPLEWAPKTDPRFEAARLSDTVLAIIVAKAAGACGANPAADAFEVACLMEAAGRLSTPTRNLMVFGNDGVVRPLERPTWFISEAALRTLQGILEERLFAAGVIITNARETAYAIARAACGLASWGSAPDTAEKASPPIREAP